MIASLLWLIDLIRWLILFLVTKLMMQNILLTWSLGKLYDCMADMNPTTDHFHVPERAITRSNTKKIQESNQENNGVADIGK